MDIETDRDKITRRSEQIGDQPLSGRTVPDFLADDIRELIEPPYRIIYRVKPERIDSKHFIKSMQLLTRGWAGVYIF
ncbi:MAG: type II toxin-antitoxin system RelE/ParE family toxin [Desulfobacterales bacterium]